MIFRSGLAAALAALALFLSGGDASSASWQETVTAAEREGKLTIVGPPVQPHRETIMQFEKAFPKIKIEFSGMMPDQFEARLAAERAAGKYLWDILISGMSSTVYERQIPQGWFDPLPPVVVLPEVLDDGKWVGGFASGFLDAEARYVYGFGAQLSGNVSFDRKRVDAKSFSYQTLLDPKWQGQIAILDPRGRGPGSVALRQIIHTLGEDGARRLLRDQNVVLGESPRGITEWAVRGRYPIVVGVSSVDLKAFQKQGIGQDVELYQDPNRFFLTGWGNVVLMNKAPNPKAAAVFVNWLLSREAQDHWARNGAYNSRRTDVEPVNPELRVDLETWTKGYNMSSHRTAKEGVAAMRLAAEALK